MKKLTKFLTVFLLALLGANLQPTWAAESYTFQTGTTIYIDFTAIASTDADLPKADAQGTEWKSNVGGKIVTVTFSNDVTWWTDQTFIKTGQGSWTDLEFSKPTTGCNTAKLASDGKSYSWVTSEHFTPNEVIYFDASGSIYWKGAPFNTKFNWIWDSGNGTQSSTGPVAKNTDCGTDAWIYVTKVPNNNYLGFIQLERLNPNGGAQWNYTNNACVMDKGANNCLYCKSENANWENTWVPGWKTYVPPMKSLSIANNSTTIISGSGTQASPYIIAAGATIKVTATAALQVDDSNPTFKYKYSVDGAVVQDYGSGNNMYQFTAGTEAHTYAVTVRAYATYNSTDNTAIDASNTIYFKVPSYTISYDPASDEGQGFTYATAPLTGVYGSTVSMTINPKTGYTVSVSAKNSSTSAAISLNKSDNTYSFTMPASNVAVTVNSTENTHSVTISNDGNGSTSPTGAQTVGEVTGIEITATPNDGYGFKEWVYTGGTISAQSATTTFKPTVDNATIQATFQSTAVYYDLTVGVCSSQSETQGTVSSSPAAGTHIQAGTAFTLTATPATGYEVEGWYSDAACTGAQLQNGGNTYSFSLSATMGVYVKFQETKYTINIATSTGVASVSPTSVSVGQITESGSITATASDGYSLNGWTLGDGISIASGTNSPITIKATKAGTITAKATETIHTITIVGGTAPSTTAGVATTGTATAATAAEGKIFNGWTIPTGITLVNCTENDETITFNASADNLTVTANYRDKNLVKLYFANYAEWPTVKAYAYGNGGGNNNTWPGEATTEETINCVTYKVFSYYSEDHSWTTVIFNNGQNEDNCKTEDLTISGNEGKYYMPNGWKQDATGILTGEWQAEPYATLWAFHIKESGADHGQDYLVSCDNNQTTASLEANTHYVFKAHNYVTGKWYGNNNSESYIRNSIENWDFYSENTGDCNMQTTEAGTYTFAISQFVTSSQIKLSVTYPTAQTFAVTISADANGSVEPNGEQQVDAFNGISVTATPNPGYRFKQWVTSDGVSVTNSTSATTTVKATKAGTLQATFTTEGMIYFNKAGIKDKWTGDVYVYFYKGVYWDTNNTPSKGSGSSTSGNCTSGPHKMNRLGNSNIYYFDYTGAGISKESNVISFTDKYLSEAANFYQCSASYRTDFHTCANMFVPRDYIDYYNECAYYSKGYWRTFQSTDPGYDIHIWNNHDGTGDKKASGDFVGTSNLSNDFTFTANLDGNHTYGFKISACGGTWYGNQGTMTQDCNWEFDSEGTYTNNCGLTTTATGEYKFTLNCTDGWLRVSVEYPLSEGDYRLAYEELSSSNITKIHPTHHIKALREDGTKKDTVSFFVEQKADAYIYLQKCTKIEGTNITWTNENGNKVDLSSFDQAAGVYNFTLTQTKSNETLTPEVALLEAYKGPYYIRTDCAGGGWSAYDIADNEMTQSNILAQNANGFDHYFVKWVAANTNVKYCVANNYSEALTDSLEDDTYIGEDKQVLPQEANVRFMWNSKTNALERAYLSGSTNTEDRYLVLIGDARMFLADGSDILEGTEENHRKGLHANELNFTDKNNWVYQADIKAQPGCAVKLTAAYNSKVQYFIGAEGEETGSRKTIISGNGTDKYIMRVVYDFKTNLLIAGWVPSDTIKSNIALGGDMLITRTHQDSAQQIIFGGDVSISDIHHVYGVLTIKKDTMLGNGTGEAKYKTVATNDDYDRTMYWISFPFKVKISEIFGVDGYGTKWIMQKYRGDLRAQKGWFKEDTPTFWEFMEKSDSLNAYEGYLFLIDANYFNTTDADVWKNSATEANFYFPSASGEIGIVKADNFSQPVSDEYHICHIDRNFKPEGMDTEMNHTITDSHWNVIGVPAFQNASGSVVHSDNNFKAFYEWDSEHNSYDVKAIVDNTEGKYHFKTMYAYMTQFYGTIKWENVSVVTTNNAPKYAYADEKNYMIELFFNGNGAEDHTYINLADEASTDFVLNEDMMKIDNAGFPNIYSFAGNYNVAYNETKMDNQTVMLGVSAPKDGNYTFSMPKDFSGTAKLVDLVEGITTDLNVANYSVDLNKGTYNNRFQLVLEVEAKTPTSIEADGQRGREADGKTTKLLRNGNIYLINGGRVYNVLGVEE